MSMPNTMFEEMSLISGFIGVIMSTIITFPLSERLLQQFFRILTQSSLVQSCRTHCHYPFYFVVSICFTMELPICLKEIPKCINELTFKSIASPFGISINISPETCSTPVCNQCLVKLNKTYINNNIRRWLSKLASTSRYDY